MEFSIPIATQKKAKHIDLITFDTSFPLVSEDQLINFLSRRLFDMSNIGMHIFYTVLHEFPKKRA